MRERHASEREGVKRKESREENHAEERRRGGETSSRCPRPA